VAPQEVFERLAVATAGGADQRRVVAVVGNVTSVPTRVTR